MTPWKLFSQITSHFHPNFTHIHYIYIYIHTYQAPTRLHLSLSGSERVLLVEGGDVDGEEEDQMGGGLYIRGSGGGTSLFLLDPHEARGSRLPTIL